jgi:hypothetical protein
VPVEIAEAFPGKDLRSTLREVALALASTTFVSVVCSKFASPFTVYYKIGNQVGAALIIALHIIP